MSERAMVERAGFKALGRDLYFDAGECDCPSDVAVLAELGYKRHLKLTGYADDHFFDRVNAEPLEGECRGCGRRFRHQWFRDGVEFQWLEPTPSNSRV